MFDDTTNYISKAIIRSQHCQRNWDLSKSIPKEDLDLLVTAATECPSKQNVAFYKAYFITNRQIIEKIHDTTKGFTTRTGFETNTQVLANLLIVFEDYNYLPEVAKSGIYRNQETDALLHGKEYDDAQNLLNRDRDMAVGVAAGYLNLTASLLGYSTGCCACFDPIEVKRILDLKNKPILMMGIGFKDPNLNRRVHHKNHKFIFPTKTKQVIPTEFID